MAPARDHIEVSIEVVVNPVAGSPRTGCHASAQVEPGRKDWWAVLARATAHADEGWRAAGDDVECGLGALETRSPGIQSSPGAPYLTAKISTTAGLLPSSLTPKRVLLLDVTLSIQKLSGFEKGAGPVYQRSEVRRTFYFLDRREARIPLLVANAAEMDAFGIREVFLRVAADMVGDTSAAAYGVVSVASGVDGAEVFLDGDGVGKTSAAGELVLRGVPVGVREIRVRGASDRVNRKSVRVIANRTVLVDLSLPGPARSADPFPLVPLGRNVQGFEEYRRGRDAAVVVKIPAGEFLMGNKETERTPLEHRVYVSDFLMDKTGVTWRQYKQFAAATGTPLPPDDPYWGIHDDHPAVYVTWEEAKSYCEWAGGRLPTEAEREKAARGTDNRKYPWGDEEPDPRRAVYRHNWGFEATEPVGAHPSGASPYGLLDMGGNVWEWCLDWYDDGYFAVSPSRDPKGPPSGSAHVVRGGSWDSRPAVLSCSCRNWGQRGYREGDFGFRCAMNDPR
jgi:formylglycine-generating enzyme required for sulfatase activity